MSMDPISDMLSSIRNGLKARLHSVETPASQLKGEIARVMKEAGYIADAVTTTEFPKKLVITLKYTENHYFVIKRSRNQSSTNSLCISPMQNSIFKCFTSFIHNLSLFKIVIIKKSVILTSIFFN